MTEAESNEQSGQEDEIEMDLDEHVEKMINIRKMALSNIETAQGRQKKYYDAKHSKYKSKYKVGALVLIKNCRKLSCKGSKLEPAWRGPYRIHETMGKGTFRLCDSSDSSKVLSSFYNITQLKLYCVPDPKSESVLLL